MSHDDCIFCRIATGLAPAFLLAEDAQCMAFMDIHPVSPGHALVISKIHVETLFDIPVPVLQAVAAMVKRVARAVDAVFQPEGITIVQANGPGAAQSVPHFHMHVLPRSLYDDLPMNWLLTPGDRREIEFAAERIRVAMGVSV